MAGKKVAKKASKEEKEPEFEIERLVQKRGEGRTLQYMVKWRGYPDLDNTWESNKDLPKNLIKKFEDAVKLKESEEAADDSDPEPPVTPLKKRGRPKSKTPAKKPETPKSGAKRGRPGRPKSYPVDDADSESEEEFVAPKKTPKKSPKKATPAKKTPVKKSPVKKVVKVEVVGREIIDNIVHYKLSNLKKAKPIYEFEDFEPIFEFELMQTQKDDAALNPVRVIERKGKKYNIEFENSRGTKSNAWCDRTVLNCVPLMNEFDDRDEDEESDYEEEYRVKKITEKRKNGRVYEYKVIWAGCDEDTATWEPADNLANAESMITAFERAESKKYAALQAKKKQKATARKSR